MSHKRPFLDELQSLEGHASTRDADVTPAVKCLADLGAPSSTNCKGSASSAMMSHEGPFPDELQRLRLLCLDES